MRTKEHTAYIMYWVVHIIRTALVEEWSIQQHFGSKLSVWKSTILLMWNVWNLPKFSAFNNNEKATLYDAKTRNSFLMMLNVTRLYSVGSTRSVLKLFSLPFFCILKTITKILNWLLRRTQLRVFGCPMYSCSYKEWNS